MNPQERIDFLEHICKCNFCAEQFSEFMTDEIITAPPDLKGNILNAVKRPEVQIARKVNETSKQMQLLWYSLKVGAATIAALVLLLLTMNFSNGFANEPGITGNPTENSVGDKKEFSLTDAIRDRMDSFSSSILDFSNNIMNTEVNNNDKKEK
jgi:hypothetical protein